MTARILALLTSTVFAFALSLPAQAQISPPASIEVGALGAAQDFDAGVMDFASGGLDPALWQGTSARMATALLEAAPRGSDNPVIADMVRTVVLSAGVPPEATSDAEAKTYARARLRAVMALGDPAALDGVAKRSPELTSDPVVRADLALAAGDVPGACTMADSVTEGRGTPAWARLRAFCHVIRDEIPAAELTAKLLGNSGYDDPVFFGLINQLTGVSKKFAPKDMSGDPLYAAMAARLEGAVQNSPLAAAAVAKDPAAPDGERLAALFTAGAHVSDTEIAQILNGIIYDGVDLEALDAAGTFDFDSASARQDALGFAQLFQLSKNGRSAEAAAEVLKRADSKGGFARFVSLMRNDLALIPAEKKAAIDLALFTRVAVITDDIGALQGLFSALEGDNRQNRIALAADALGNGFRLGTLGQYIETRLSKDGADKRRAVRDALLALALGATLSDAGIAGLTDASGGQGRTIKAGDLAILKAASKASSRAETTLRAAILLDGAPLDAASLAAVVDALMTAQLTDFGGQIAAQDFVRALP